MTGPDDDAELNELLDGDPLDEITTWKTGGPFIAKEWQERSSDGYRRWRWRGYRGAAALEWSEWEPKESDARGH